MLFVDMWKMCISLIANDVTFRVKTNIKQTAHIQDKRAHIWRRDGCACRVKPYACQTGASKHSMNSVSARGNGLLLACEHCTMHHSPFHDISVIPYRIRDSMILCTQ